MRINAEIPWDIEIPWLDSQAAGRLGSLTAFAAQVADLAGGLPQAQPSVQSDPALVAGIEQKLERELTTLILSHFGPVRVLGEEHFNAFGAYAHMVPGRFSFAVDPLDGSKSYAAGNTTYAVSVAGCVDGMPVFGFVYQPSTGTMYSAARNAGAFADGRRIVAPRYGAPRRAAVRSGMAGSSPVRAAVENLRRKSYQLERMECTSLKFCWLAEGLRAGLVKQIVERDGVLCIWGTAAGQLIASEAGVGCASLDRGPWRWAAGAVAAGDPRFLTDLFTASDDDHQT